ncbi:hypothetical protein LCGC14_2690340 [marine sediment metagenome]|uniref:HNH nuclease domain-containing protein n=1 Tax=marine sediment metagenome TaxID=412755 RepID=A0A0F9BTD3_9ZZZZ
MSEHLGRPIKKEEIIHHINMIRDDNRLENLHLYPNRKKHLTNHGSLNKLVKKLLENKMIKFENGEYKMNVNSSPEVV